MQKNLSISAVSGLALAIALSGCAVKPVAMTTDEREQLISRDLSALYKNQEPVSGPLSLEQAMERAARYNLDHRLQKMQLVLEDRALSLANMDMLPSLMAQAGYSVRDKETASTSLLIESDILSNNPSTSVERKRSTSSLAFSWNALDFGVSYYRAKQSANAVLMAEERRRRVMNTLAQDVQSAFWEAYAAQQAGPEIETLLVRVNGALADAERIERERLMPPTQILQYKKSLLEQAQQLESLQGDMARSRVRLAALINASPGERLTLVAETAEPLAKLEANPADLEAQALRSRPELVEAHYETRNAQLEARKLLVKLLPGLEVGYGTYHDSNKYLINNSWQEGSLQLSWNLFNVFRYSDQKAYVDAQQQVTDAKRLALTMAVMAQVHVAWHDYQQAMHQYERVQTLVKIEEGLRTQSAAKARESAGSQLDDIRAASSLVLTRLHAQQLRARALQARAMLDTSIGKDMIPAVAQAERQGAK